VQGMLQGNASTMTGEGKSHTRNCGVITICVCGEWGGNGRRIYLNVVAAQIRCTAYGETPAHTSQRGGATPRTNYRKGRELELEIKCSKQTNTKKGEEAELRRTHLNSQILAIWNLMRVAQLHLCAVHSH
jgi:hypothetical protein